MTEQDSLTERQQHILEFIRDQIAVRGYGPTVREIGNQFGIKSPNGVMCHLKALEKKGLITRESYSARAIQVTDYKPGTELPLLGNVAAGTPIQAAALDEKLNFHDLFCGPNHYTLKVRGQSMIEDHIDDGDYVVIKGQETARNGERVVAMVDGEVTLKKFHKTKDHITLIPSNKDLRPIEVKPGVDVRILGVLVGVLRKC